MPKCLSLKKLAPIKGQKSITQFFKSQDVVASNLQSKSNDIALSPSLKRKAISPVTSNIKGDKNGPEETASERQLKKKKTLALNLLEAENQGKNCKVKSAKAPKVHQIKSSDNKTIKLNTNIKNGTIQNIIKEEINEEDDFKVNKSIKSKTIKDPAVTATNKKKKSPNKENGILKSPRKQETVLINHVLNDAVKNERSPLKSKLEENTKCNHVMMNDSYIDDKVEKSPFKTPEKCVRRLSSTPKKSPVVLTPEPRMSPTVHDLKIHVSPSRNGCTVKVALDFDTVITKDSKNNDKNYIYDDNDMIVDKNDIFNDDWNLNEVDEEDLADDLDLTNIQRCEVINVNESSSSSELSLKNTKGERGTCLIEGIWRDLPLTPGEVISLKATRDNSGKFHINNQTGILVFRPDHLMSTTSVLSGVFCKRKAILQDRFKGVDSGNNAMIIGIIIHELVQKALVHRIISLDKLREETKLILKQSLQLLYDAGLSIEEARSNIDIYLKPLAEFMQTYMGDRNGDFVKGQWQGRIDRVLDIEENLYCPQLGLKGKIDATLEVTIHNTKGSQSGIVPLELKSGKASGSAEHRGQLLMYVMMLSELQDNFDEQLKPLLLYLKDKVQLIEVSGGYPEKRDLIMLRNEMVQYISEKPLDKDIDQVRDIEEASHLLVQRLPEPINHETACSRCPYLTLCSLHLWHTPGPKVSECHPLSKLRPQALEHITPAHIKYVLHWSALIRLEERTQLNTAPIHRMWTEDCSEREKRGSCAANLTLKSVTPSGDKYLHVFERNHDLSQLNICERSGGPLEGEFCIVGVKARPWIAAGLVAITTQQHLHIMLERDLTNRWSPETVYHVDTYESYATTSHNLTNLGALLDDNECGDRLRRLIIDKTAPEFIEKLPREVGRLGAKLMRNLNIEQQRAILRALAAKHYALIQGLPGTGKTQTISVLIQMLVAMKLRVLVTAHTHSAVDTMLKRLPSSLKIMRLGATSRIAPSLVEKSEQRLTAKCETPEQLTEVYDSMEVVGVTCLGATHALLARTNFDVCIVDEATQVLQCTVIRPLLSSSRFVLVGDPEQLPPVVKNKAARRLGMEESLFHRLKESAATCTLRVEYRLNQPLVEVANLVAYEGQLKCADDTVGSACLDVNYQNLTANCNASNTPWLITACSPAPENAAMFINMHNNITHTNSNKGCVNSDEACVVLAIVKALIENGVKDKDIGVIAPYREQVTLLRNCLKRYCDADSPEVSTVDQFQGRDKSVILYSCTRSDYRKAGDVKEGEVLSDRRRMAVSVTRAKHKFLVIGHGDALKRYAPLQLLIDNIPHILLGKHDIDLVKERYGTFVK